MKPCPDCDASTRAHCPSCRGDGTVDPQRKAEIDAIEHSIRKAAAYAGVTDRGVHARVRSVMLRCECRLCARWRASVREQVAIDARCT